MADVQSIKRAFDILRAVAQGENSVGLSEIARQVDLPKSTVSRLLATLESQGAIKRLLETDGSRADSYQIGDGIVTLAANVSYPRTLIAVARPYLQELSQLSGETISLGIPDGDMGKTIEQIHSHSELQLRSWVGKRLPLYCTSDGKLYLAEWDEKALSEYLQRPLERYTENTITDPAQLRQELAEIRSQGFAWNRRERDSDLGSVAAPIRNEEGQTIASVCIFGPSFRFPPEGRQEEYVQLAIATANKIAYRIQILTNRSALNGGMR